MSKKVICICPTKFLEPVTAATVLFTEYGYETRSVAIGTGILSNDEQLWADEIVCMTLGQEEQINSMNKVKVIKIQCLNIEGAYTYMDPILIELIRSKYQTSTEVEGTKTIKLAKPNKVKKDKNEQ